jgi:hypothetical protein
MKNEKKQYRNKETTVKFKINIKDRLDRNCPKNMRFDEFIEKLLDDAGYE